MPFRSLPLTTKPDKWQFNHAAIKDILRELDIDFSDGSNDFVMHCFVSERCEGHQKKTLYLNCSERAGRWHCFRCDAKGYIDQLVKIKTGWGQFKVVSFLSAHQAYFDPNDQVERKYETVHLSQDILESYQWRHAYCYDRKLTEETLVRYNIGYDRNTNEIVFPWYSVDGTLAAIKKRAIINRFYRFMPTDDFKPTIFGIHLIVPQSILWITEGEFDAMYVDQCLQMNAFEAQGAIALGGKVLQRNVLGELQSICPSLVIIALDNDVEGQVASKELRTTLGCFVSCERYIYEDGVKDANDSSEEHIVAEARRFEEIAAGLRA